jgi:hypothetical protein
VNKGSDLLKAIGRAADEFQSASLVKPIGQWWLIASAFAGYTNCINILIVENARLCEFYCT